jgi:hypothetical protein
MNMRVHRLVTHLQAEEAYTVVEFLDQLRAVLMQSYGQEITQMLKQAESRVSHDEDDDWLNPQKESF